MCDRLTLVREQQRLLSADQLPDKHLLLAHSKLSRHHRVKNTPTDYPGDSTKQLDGIVLRKHGFENTAPYKIHVGKECCDDLNRGVIPGAALANEFWVGTLPSHLEGITFVERAAAYPGSRHCARTTESKQRRRNGEESSQLVAAGKRS